MASASGEEEVSPKNSSNRLKFLCSYGGRILPRPPDGHLKYVGGETRVLAVPRAVAFAELKTRADAMLGADAAIKYQLLADDLDALVSITCDEDVHHMLDELSQHGSRPSSSCGSPKLRVFLFPSVVTALAAVHFEDPARLSAAALEQRYVDATNGISVSATGMRSNFTSSANTSPGSTVDSAVFSSREPLLGGRSGMHRVRSTPNLSSSASQTSSRASSPWCPHPNQPTTAAPQLPRQPSVTYGMQTGGMGSWRTSGGHLIGPGPAVWFDMCSPHHPAAIHQHQPPWTYRYTPAATGGAAAALSRTASGGCTYCRHVDEYCGPKGGPGFSYDTTAQYKHGWE